VNFRFGLGCLSRSMNIGCFGSKVTHSLRIVLVLHVVHSQNSCHSERCLFPMFPTSWRCDQADRWESRFCPVLCRNNLCTTPFPVNSKGYAENFLKTYMGGWLVGFFSKTKFFLKEKYLYNGPFCGTNF
jgi:hypothetical protein